MGEAFSGTQELQRSLESSSPLVCKLGHPLKSPEVLEKKNALSFSCSPESQFLWVGPELQCYFKASGRTTDLAWILHMCLCWNLDILLCGLHLWVIISQTLKENYPTDNQEFHPNYMNALATTEKPHKFCGAIK